MCYTDSKPGEGDSTDETHSDHRRQRLSGRTHPAAGAGGCGALQPAPRLSGSSRGCRSDRDHSETTACGHCARGGSVGHRLLCTAPGGSPSCQRGAAGLGGKSCLRIWRKAAGVQFRSGLCRNHAAWAAAGDIAPAADQCIWPLQAGNGTARVGTLPGRCAAAGQLDV